MVAPPNGCRHYLAPCATAVRLACSVSKPPLLCYGTGAGSASVEVRQRFGFRVDSLFCPQMRTCGAATRDLGPKGREPRAVSCEPQAAGCDPRSCSRFLRRRLLQCQFVDFRGVFQGQLLEAAEGHALVLGHQVLFLQGRSSSSTPSSARVVGIPRLAKKLRVSSMAESASAFTSPVGTSPNTAWP